MFRKNLLPSSSRQKMKQGIKDVQLFTEGKTRDGVKNVKNEPREAFPLLPP
jgi:hypothetical protein